jgi:hypothetical protein
LTFLSEDEWPYSQQEKMALKVRGRKWSNTVHHHLKIFFC